MEEYIESEELSKRIKFSKQSIYNLIYRNKLVLGEHYLKPSRKKILFKWSEILRWLGEPEEPGENNATKTVNPKKERIKRRNLINI